MKCGSYKNKKQYNPQSFPASGETEGVNRDKKKQEERKRGRGEVCLPTQWVHCEHFRSKVLECSFAGSWIFIRWEIYQKVNVTFWVCLVEAKIVFQTITIMANLIKIYI